MASRGTVTALRGLYVVGLAALGAFAAGKVHRPTDRTFHITASKYAYNPSIIHVNKGDRVRIYLTSLDVTHGFYLDGYDLDAKISPDDKPYERRPLEHTAFHKVPYIQFIATREGKFRFRCSQTCGFMHPFMIGEMVVAPNREFAAGIGGLVAVAMVALLAGAGTGMKKHG
ncbi:MAG: hypothetical protein KGJ62_09080 [Armatimonadetes bacterium]|nr:hypothetical protein [Armatimonadota bacterium]MDE2206428.1 hypothetical protein [Armatimonadota bacterium]